MKLVRKSSFEPFNTIQTIRADLQAMIHQSLLDQGKPSSTLHNILVPSKQTLKEVLFNPKTKL